MHGIRQALPYLLATAALGLAACQLFPSPQATPTPMPSPAPLLEPTATPPPPTPEPTSPSPQVTPAAAVAEGEIVFVRGGNLWAIGADGSNERQLTAYAPDTVLRDLTPSPDGRRLALTLDGHALAVYDFAEGQISVLDMANDALIAAPVWLPEGDAVVYQRVPLNPQTSAPAAGEVWMAALDALPRLLIGASALPEDPQAAFAPAFALSGNRLLVTALSSSEETPVRFLIADLSSGVLAPFSVPELETPAVWDVSPDGTKALLYEQAAPHVLYLADLNAEGNVATIAQISPPDGRAYRMARFAPDGVRLMALRAPLPESGEGVEALLLTPAEDGAYTATVLNQDVGFNHLMVRWHGEDGVILQRMSTDGGDAELWLAPLDGSVGTFLTAGEQPVVVGG